MRRGVLDRRLERRLEQLELGFAADQRRLEMPFEGLGTDVEMEDAIPVRRLVRHDVHGARHEAQRVGPEQEIVGSGRLE